MNDCIVCQLPLPPGDVPPGAPEGFLSAAQVHVVLCSNGVLVLTDEGKFLESFYYSTTSFQEQKPMEN